MLRAHVDAGFLQSSSSNHTVRCDLRNPAVVSIGGGKFRERVDLLHADELVRDSTIDARLPLNSSVLPPGGYVLRVEGCARSGKLERLRRLASVWRGSKQVQSDV